MTDDLPDNLFGNIARFFERKLGIIKNIDLHTDADFVNEIKQFSSLPGWKAMIGLTRTNFARLSAAGVEMRFIN